MQNEKMQEIEGQLDDWPALEPGKKTRVVVCGLFPKAGGEAVQSYWRGEFEELSTAQYWGPKKEREFKARGFSGASAIYWQHDITEDDAVDRLRRQLADQ